jgi:hypothetical protein
VLHRLANLMRQSRVVSRPERWRNPGGGRYQEDALEAHLPGLGHRQCVFGDSVRSMNG